MEEEFVDTNMFLRHLLQDVPSQSARATELIRRIEDGAVRAHISDIVVFEVVFTLARSYKQPKAAIRDAVLALLDLPGIILPGKRRFHRVFDLYVDLNISFADAYHVVLMGQQSWTQSSASIAISTASRASRASSRSARSYELKNARNSR